MADLKITALPHQTTAVLGTDYLVMVDDPTGSAATKYVTVAEVLDDFDATAAETTTGTSTALYVTPDGLAGSGYGKRTVELDLCGAGELAVGDKRYFRVPSWMNGWNLVELAAMCYTPSSSSDGIIITIKNGATSMVTTDLTIDTGEYDSLTDAHQPVIDTANDDVATGDQIEAACWVAGADVTYLVVEMTFQLP